jgi:hypothetical protein
MSRRFAISQAVIPASERQVPRSRESVIVIGVCTTSEGEQRFGQFAFVRAGAHDGRQDGHFHTEGANGVGLGGVAAVNDESAGEVGVEFGDGGGGRAAAKLGKHFVTRAFERFAADDRANGKDAFFARAQLFADARHGENRANTDERIAGTNDHAIGVANGFEHARCGVSVLDAFEVNGADAGNRVVLDEVFLKVHAAVARFDDGGNGLIGHWKDAGFDAERVANVVGGLRESFAVREHVRAMNMRGEVAIAEIEPSFVAIHSEALEEIESFAAEAPSRCGIHNASESVRDDVEIGRDFEAVHADVIARVDDDGEFVGIHGFVKAEEKLGGPDAAGERSDREVFGRGHREIRMPG